MSVSVRDALRMAALYVVLSILWLALAEVMLHEKILPDEFINAGGNGVTDAYLEWCRPLLGDPIDHA